MLFPPFFILGIDLYSNSERKEKSYTLNKYCRNIIDSRGKVSQLLSHGTNKCLLHTNIAETSLRITLSIVSFFLQGVVYVIDSGFSKQKFYNPVNHHHSFCLYLLVPSFVIYLASLILHVFPCRFQILKVLWWHQYPKHLLDRGLVELGEFGLESVTGNFIFLYKR